MYSILEETENKFLTVLSGGTIEAREKYAFSLRSFDCRMLLYTRKGSGILRIPEQTIHMVSPYSSIPAGLEKLLQNGNGSFLRNKLTDAAILNNILTTMWIEGFQLKSQEVISRI